MRIRAYALCRDRRGQGGVKKGRASSVSQSSVARVDSCCAKRPERQESPSGLGAGRQSAELRASSMNRSAEAARKSSDIGSGWAAFCIMLYDIVPPVGVQVTICKSKVSSNIRYASSGKNGYTIQDMQSSKILKFCSKYRYLCFKMQSHTILDLSYFYYSALQMVFLFLLCFHEYRRED